MNDNNNNNKITEGIENYWAGYYEASKPTMYCDGLQLFLKSRNLFFDLEKFHPGDAKTIRETIEYKRGQFEFISNVKMDKDMPVIVQNYFEDDINSLNPDSRNYREISGYDALRRLEELYGTIDEEKDRGCFDPDFYFLYKKFTVNNPRFLHVEKKIKIKKLEPEAQLPKKDSVLDVGYMLFGVFEKGLNYNCELFNTQLEVSPPYGFYLEIHPHHELKEKHGRSFVLPTPMLIGMGSSSKIKFKLKKDSSRIPPLPENTPIAILVPKYHTHMQMEVEEVV